MIGLLSAINIKSCVNHLTFEGFSTQNSLNIGTLEVASLLNTDVVFVCLNPKEDSVEFTLGCQTRLTTFFLCPTVLNPLNS